MRIGDYVVVSSTRTGYLACRGGLLYRLTRCSLDMTQPRAEAVMSALGKAVKPGSNVLVPDIVEEDDAWYAAVPFRPEVFQGLPRAYLRCLPEAARRHMILLAVSAMDTLARDGIVHGSLDPDCFRITVTESGMLGVVLEDLRHVGCGRLEPLESDTESSYAAPEVRRGGKPTTASDAFSLALCLHEWLAGELPRCRGNGPDLTKDSVWLSAAVPVWARGVMADLLNANAASRPTLTEALTRLAKGDEAATVAIYSCESDPEEDADIRTLLLEEDPKLARRYAE